MHNQGEKYQFKLKKAGNKPYIFDIIRKKYIVLTPEEKVRQYFIHFLIEDLNYPANFIKVESGLQVNKMNKRTDILVFNRNFKPKLMVECKSEKVSLNQKTLDQISTYNQPFHLDYLIITNGLSTYCFQYDTSENSYRHTIHFPMFSDL